MSWDDDLSDDEWDDDYPDEDDAESLVKACPECGQDVYEDAEQCPHCGHYILHEDVATPFSNWPKSLVLLGFIGVILTILALSGLF
jgi:hypothetical protein